MTKSFEVYNFFREANDRFDHFILGALLAICAYLVQSNPYSKLGLNESTIYLFSLISFGIASVFAFKRIEHVILAYSLNSTVLYSHERGNIKAANKTDEELTKVKDKIKNYYDIRNRLGLLGFITYIFAKYWAVYCT